MKTYHVLGNMWREGNDIKSFSQLQSDGNNIEWKWDYPKKFGNEEHDKLVFCFNTIDRVQWFRNRWANNSRVAEIEIPDDIINDKDKCIIDDGHIKLKQAIPYKRIIRVYESNEMPLL